MNHYPACAKATGRKCECRYCCGSLHGWTDAVRLARESDDVKREEFREKAESKWRAAFAGRTRARPSFPKKGAAIDLCRADIIDWLARERTATESNRRGGHTAVDVKDDRTTDPAHDVLRRPDAESISNDTAEFPTGFAATDPVVDQIATAGNEFIKGALDDIAREFDGRIPDNVKIALADHFWCDLLAQIAHVLHEGFKHLDSVPDRITDLVMMSRKEARWREIEKRLVRIAARSVWGKVEPFGTVIRRVALPVIRLLAVLICKAPERHQAVVEYCVDPLGKQLLSETKKRLTAVLFDWLPRLRGSSKQ